MESKNERGYMSKDEFRIIQTIVIDNFSIRQRKYYRFRRVKEWVAITINKQQLIKALKSLEDNGEIISKQMSGHKLYKKIDRNSSVFN